MADEAEAKFFAGRNSKTFTGGKNGKSVHINDVSQYADLYDGKYGRMRGKLNAGLEKDPPETEPHGQINDVFNVMFKILVNDKLTKGRVVEIEDFADLCQSLHKLRDVLADNATNRKNALMLMKQYPWVDLLITEWKNWRIRRNGIIPTEDMIYTVLVGGGAAQSDGQLKKYTVKCGRLQGLLECKQIAELLDTTTSKYRNCVPLARKDFGEKKGLEPIDYVDAKGQSIVVWPTLNNMQRMLKERVKKIDKDGVTLKSLRGEKRPRICEVKNGTLSAKSSKEKAKEMARIKEIEKEDMQLGDESSGESDDDEKVSREQIEKEDMELEDSSGESDADVDENEKSRRDEIEKEDMDLEDSSGESDVDADENEKSRRDEIEKEDMDLEDDAFDSDSS